MQGASKADASVDWALDSHGARVDVPIALLFTGLMTEPLAKCPNCWSVAWSCRFLAFAERFLASST